MVKELQNISIDAKIAIVGNATPSKDYSELIDSHDFVIRLNHFYNIPTGLVGTKVDALIIANPTVFSVFPYVIDDYKDKIYSFYDRFKNRQKSVVQILEMPKDDRVNEHMTTGVIGILYILERFNPNNVSVFGFSNGRDKLEYTLAYHKSKVFTEMKILNNLESLGVKFYN